MENTPEVCLITTDWEPQVPVLTIEYDQPAARALGLSRSDVSLSLLTATGGIPIGSFYEGIHKNNIYLKCLDGQGKPIEDLGNTQVFSTLPSLNGLLNEENMVKLKAGTLSKEELIESLMGSTPLKQISKGIDVRWEDRLFLATTDNAASACNALPCRVSRRKSTIGSRGKVGADRTPRRLFAAMAG